MLVPVMLSLMKTSRLVRITHSKRYVKSEMCTKVVYQDVSMVKLTVPYIPSFLGFREADIFCEMVLSLELMMLSC